MNQRRTAFLVLGTLSLVFVCSAASWAADDDDREATVWTMSNDPAGNAVLAFRFADGALTPLGSVSTGGLGSGGREPDFGLANAHGIQLSKDNQFMFVVNAGSNDVSVFSVGKKSLTLLDRVPSGGLQPVSVTVNDDLVYVLNAGGSVGSSDNITGFQFNDDDGTLTKIAGSTRLLSAAHTQPAQVEFTPNGRVLVVTEELTNNIDTFTVDEDGRASGPLVTPSDAVFPFGFEIANRNQLFVSDDFNDGIGLAALSSFTIGKGGTLHLVSSDVKSNESGACWVAISKSGRFAIVANTVSSTISVYSINKKDASLTPVNAVSSLFAPTDLSFSHDGRLLFALQPDEGLKGSPGINVFEFNPDDGTLTPLPGVSGLPRSIDGLVAR